MFGTGGGSGGGITPSSSSSSTSGNYFGGGAGGNIAYVLLGLGVIAGVVIIVFLARKK